MKGKRARKVNQNDCSPPPKLVSSSWKGLYPYQGTISEFLATPIQAFRWRRFFQGVTAMRPDVVKMFYKGYINEEELYTMVKSKKLILGQTRLMNSLG
ncbi:hypothetical protein E6C27_scaffold829G00190 [Cucumis melo var. makuwa]|uniref:Uncharacterized protein n=1 Tax=Cucumis melo var. makuwa TaxID=1194695 RepID=A0A5A7U060_CUCMM|nr:hypothetical protein E6C27_scaffold829G00190 [Cucumis melo var. makuwa]